MSYNNNYSTVRNTYQGKYIHSPIEYNPGDEVVPVFPSRGYASLTHGNVGSGYGYYNVKNAYPDWDKSCTEYTQRLCNGELKQTTFDPSKPPGYPTALYQDSGVWYQTGRGLDIDRYLNMTSAAALSTAGHWPPASDRQPQPQNHVQQVPRQDLVKTWDHKLDTDGHVRQKMYGSGDNQLFLR